MVKEKWIKDLGGSEEVETEFMILEKETKLFVSKEGEYLQLQLGDKTGEISAICWNPQLIKSDIKKGDVIKVKGIAQKHKEYGLQIIFNPLDIKLSEVKGLFAISAIDKNKKIADFSSRGSETSFAAPGVDILVPYLNNKFAKLSGTSFSAPFLSGCIALILSKHKNNPGSTPINNLDDLFSHLLYITEDLGKKDRDDEYGFGMINFDKWDDVENKIPKKLTLCQKIKKWFKK